MPPAPAAWPYPSWIAHRGAGRTAPENTLAAFRAGFAAGFRMFECDVKLSADGVPFLLHDADLERTTSGHGRAGDQPWAALSQLDAGAWHSAPFAGEPIPTLAALARWLNANGAAVNLEIKPTPGTEAATGTRVAALAAQLWSGHAPPPLLSSFSVEAMQAAARAAPALPRALLLDDLDGDWTGVVRTLGCVAVVFHAPLVTAAHVDRLHAEGRRVLAYTVNEPAEAARLQALGLDGLITDAVDRFGAAARGAGA
jgi:glycerophosphoryl diester phosphodiesterase